MKSPHQLHLVLLFIFLLLFTKLSTQKHNKKQLFIRKNHLTTPDRQPTRIECPTCGLRNHPGLAGSSILNCKRFFVNHGNDQNNNNQDPNDTGGLLPSYKCTCNYTTVNKKECGSKFDQQDHEFGQPRVHGECLVAHVGMAISGYNLMHRKWVSKEHCFNLCLRTRVKNGHSFDCTSFEHWHRDCNEMENKDKICASFAENEDIDPIDESSPVRNIYGRSYFKENRHYNTYDVNDHTKNKKRATKPDICVLSNQTISISTNNFLPNDKVTYYEILCKDSTSEESTTPVSEDELKLKEHTSTVAIEKEVTELATTSSIPQYLKGLLDTNSLTTVAKSNKECQFNPCLNGGACLLIDKFRFTCLCKDFYYGVYCEISGVQKTCHKTMMEITINNELTSSLNIQLSDLFINRKNAQLPCQLKEVNETHSRFSIPYRMCSTFVSNINGEIVYTNKLFSQIRTSRTSKEQINKYDYLMSLECREASTEPTWSNPPVKSNSSHLVQYHETSEATSRKTVTAIKRSCLIESFKLRMRIFYDKLYQDEFVPRKNNKVDYDQNLNVQFFVEYSDRLNELYQMQKRLQYLHLTLLNCWLTTSSSSYSDVIQILVENGCPEEGVLFYDSTVVKNSIQFSFKIARPPANDISSQFFLHCEPEICTDSQLADSTEDAEFYRNFKVCENITAMCHTKNVNAEYALMNSLDDLEIKQQRMFKTKEERCNSTLLEGPFVFSQTKGVKYTKVVNSTSAIGLMSLWIIVIIHVLVSLCFV